MHARCTHTPRLLLLAAPVLFWIEYAYARAHNTNTMYMLKAFEAAKKRRRVEAAATVVATERPSSTDNGAQQEDGDGDGEYAEGDYDEGEEGGEDYFEDGEEDYEEEEVGVSEEVIERLSGKDALFELLGVKKDVGGRVRNASFFVQD